MRYGELTKFTEIFTPDYKAGRWIIDASFNPMVGIPEKMPKFIYDHAALEFAETMRTSEFADADYVLNMGNMGMAYEEIVKLQNENVDFTDKEILTILTYIAKSEGENRGILKKVIDTGVLTKLLLRLKELD